MLNDLMDRISGWMKLEDEMNALFENATSVIGGLGEEKVKLCTERDLLRVKIAGRAKEHEETTTLLKRTGVILKKLTDENAMLHIKRERLVKESVDVAKQRVKDMKLMKEIIAAHRKN